MADEPADDGASLTRRSLQGLIPWSATNTCGAGRLVIRMNRLYEVNESGLLDR